MTDQPVVKITLERIYETLLEVKGAVSTMSTGNEHRDRDIDRHGSDIDDLKRNSATKAELDKVRTEQVSRSRWAIGIAVSAVGVLVTGAGVLVALATVVWS